jgi:hypothetical protein
MADRMAKHNNALHIDAHCIDPESMAICMAPKIMATVYAELDEQKILLPDNATNPNEIT